MKKGSLITLFIGVNVLFIFLQIHKHTQFVKYGYMLQECEKQRDVLHTKKQMLMQHLHAHIDRESIKRFAGTKLNMRPIKLSQIKKINENGN